MDRASPEERATLARMLRGIRDEKRAMQVEIDDLRLEFQAVLAHGRRIEDRVTELERRLVVVTEQLEALTARHGRLVEEVLAELEHEPDPERTAAALKRLH